MYLMEIAWPAILATLAWRGITGRPAVQKRIHDLGTPLAAVMQWYFGFFLTVGLLLAWTLVEIFGHYRQVDSETVRDNIYAIWQHNLTGTFNESHGMLVSSGELLGVLPLEQDFEDILEIPYWVLQVNLVSQLACLPSFLIALCQARKVILSGVALARTQPESRELPWYPSRIVNTLLLVIAMPTVFSIMSLRSTVRIWSLITGVAEGVDHLSWSRVTAREMGRYRGDMELAMVFQFFTVLSFSRLASFYLTESRLWNEAVRWIPPHEREDLEDRAEEYKQTLFVPAFLGVYCFCIVGICRCVLNFLMAESRVHEGLELWAQSFHVQVLDKVDTVFLVTTVMCVINMFWICRMKDITDKLGNANLKFTGTRVLILIAQVQLKIIGVFEVDSQLYEFAKSKKEQISQDADSTFGIDLDFINKWNLTECGGNLLHVSLLGFECLAIAIFNSLVWGTDVTRFDLRSGAMRAQDVGYSRVGAPPRKDDHSDADEGNRPRALDLLARCRCPLGRVFSGGRSRRAARLRTPADYAVAATIQREASPSR